MNVPLPYLLLAHQRNERRKVHPNSASNASISQEENGSSAHDEGSKRGSNKGVSGTGEGSGALGCVGSTGGLDLAIGDLSDDCDGGGGRSLRLSVGDLGDDGSGSTGSLRLSVGDLGNDGSGSTGCLRLSVGDLGDDGSGSWRLNLSV